MADQMHAVPERGTAAGSPQQPPWPAPIGAAPQQFQAESGVAQQPWPPQQPSGPSPSYAQPQKSRFGIGFLVGFAAGFALAVAGILLLGALWLQGGPADLGDSERTDMLYEQCEQGDMGACDLLYLESAPGSRLEEFGATCGGRTPYWQEGTCLDADIEAG